MSRHEIQLDSGRRIRLTALDQWGTYAGLLEGLPTREMNARIIQETLEGARRRWHFPPYLIQPAEKPIEIVRSYPFGTPASIPEITCVAHFDCFDKVRDPNLDGSTLPLVWFQADFAFPIEEAIQTQIRALDWDRYATDFGY